MTDRAEPDSSGIITRWGFVPILTFVILAGLGLWLLPTGIAQLVGQITALIMLGGMLWFFRDPARRTQATVGQFVAPADGVVADIIDLDETEHLHCRCVRIGIFMSVFDVHVNRMPIQGTVTLVQASAGTHRDARSVAAIAGNQAMALILEVDRALVPTGLRLKVRQITGLIATRIICVAQPGRSFQRGERFGMIRFGSRVEVWLPLAAGCTLLVHPGQRVTAGQTVIAQLPLVTA